MAENTTDISKLDDMLVLSVSVRVFFSVGTNVPKCVDDHVSAMGNSSILNQQCLPFGLQYWALFQTCLHLLWAWCHQLNIPSIPAISKHSNTTVLITHLPRTFEIIQTFVWDSQTISVVQSGSSCLILKLYKKYEDHDKIDLECFGY